MHLRRRLPAVTARSLALAASAVVAAALTVVAQFAWLVAFDSTGLDVVVPDPLWLVVGPAATTAVLPVALARRWFGRPTTVRVGVVVLVAGMTVAAVSLDAWAVCSPC